MWGFLLACLAYWAITGFLGDLTRLPAMIAGLLCCYGCGTLWYSYVYLGGSISILPALAQCVLPYLIPDVLKLFLAHQLAHRLRRFLR